MNNLTELLEEQVKDLYNAENQLTKALPRMAKFASTGELREAFELHLEETQGHLERLEQVCELMGFKPTGKVCAAMKGLVEEGKEVMEEDGDDSVLDAAMVAAAQRIEHYEIAAYGTVKAIAQQLGRDDVVKLFDATLKEEVATDEKLTQVAESAIYSMTPKSEDDGEQEDDEETSAATGGGKSRGGRSGGGSSRSGGRSGGGRSSGRSSSSSGGGGGRRAPSRAAAAKGGRNSHGGGRRKTSRSR